ncbi:MAG TPA: alpha/beta hydrolase [Ilumatobacteraceae bacterium]|nr:alpha/beta hydrolase [Ilumatobacteraceae bacterium]
MPTARLNGIDVHYERGGDGPRLLFCNGSGATLESSAPVIARFREHFDVVAHDQRGLGRTTIPDGPYTMADYAADAAALLDHVGWDRCAVVGISFGGMVAQELAVTWPERLTRLALVCTSPGGPGRASYPLHELAELPPAEAAAVGLALLDTRFSAEWLASHPQDRALVEGRAARGAGPKPAAVRRGELAQLQARRHHDVWERLPRVSCPTLVAGGRYDGIAPPANSEAIASRIAGAELRLYEGGHLFFLQDRAAFPDIVEFLAAG